MSNQNRQLYIVISQTGTLLSRILKQITGAEYNHASISLSRDLERMYSFGRRHPYNPFWGGFVIESPRTGTFKRFSETKVLVLSVSVTEEQHAELKEMLDVMWKRRRKYSYNYIGLRSFLKYFWLGFNLVCSIPEAALKFPRESAGKVSQIRHSACVIQ